MKDTILLIDQGRILNSGSHCIVNGHYFEIVEKKNNAGSVTQVELRSFVLRGNNFILTLAYANQKILTSVYYSIRENMFEVGRVSTFDPSEFDY